MKNCFSRNGKRHLSEEKYQEKEKQDEEINLMAVRIEENKRRTFHVVEEEEKDQRSQTQNEYIEEYKQRRKQNEICVLGKKKRNVTN